MSDQIILNLMMLSPLVLHLIGLTIAIMVDPYVSRKHRGILLVITELILSLVLQGQLDYNLKLHANIQQRVVVDTYGYIMRPIVLALFFHVSNDKSRNTVPVWILVGINTIVFLVSAFTGIAFSITPQNTFQRGPLGYTCHIISIVLLFALLFQTIREKSRDGVSGSFIPTMNVLLVVGSIFADYHFGRLDTPVSFLTIAMCSAAVFYYVWLHLRFVREHEEDLRAQQRIRIMISQIQPHFMFNTLSTIQALCRIDPEKAFETTEKFGTYLRNNIESLNKSELIPLRKELEHTKIYADIEMIRFPRIRVEYYIEDEDFNLPTLTIQPLVENAIRHGVRGRNDGRVIVATRKVDGFHEVMIRDNGKGFNAENIDELEASHIGLRNVRDRIESMCDGEMEIESYPDRGTTITLAIPE
ncbi:MAG: histidine kinase [Lachnospiraceae bacterium]|nr:histidine kinase [Lachnospiraceae bacterium]